MKDRSQGDVFYELGDWIVEPGLNRLRRGDVSRQVEPKTMDVLAYLLEHAGEIVTVGDLLESIWQDRVVEPTAVHRNVNQIRRALGDSTRQSRYVETVTKRGYRVIAPVVRRAREAPQDTDLLSALGAVTPPFPAYTGSNPYQFVCYAHANRVEVYSEIVQLHDDGANLWYDEGIPPGSMWTQEIADAINGCKELLFFVTPDAVRSVNCLNEFQFAVSRGKRILAIHLQPTQLPASLELSMGTTQALHKHALREEDYRRKIRQGLGHSTGPALFDKPLKRQRFNWRVSLAGVAIVLIAAFAGWLYWSVPAPTAWSVAVVPFAEMSEFDGDGWMAQSITTEIQAGLAQLPGIRLAGRSASPGFQSASSQTHQPTPAQVDKLIEGTVRRSGQRIRVTVQLVSVSDGYQIWSDVYDEELADNFAAEIEIAQRVVEAIGRIAGTESTPQLQISEFEDGFEEVLLPDSGLDALDDAHPLEDDDDE